MIQATSFSFELCQALRVKEHCPKNFKENSQQNPFDSFDNFVNLFENYCTLLTLNIIHWRRTVIPPCSGIKCGSWVYQNGWNSINYLGLLDYKDKIGWCLKYNQTIYSASPIYVFTKINLWHWDEIWIHWFWKYKYEI